MDARLVSLTLISVALVACSSRGRGGGATLVDSGAASDGASTSDGGTPARDHDAAAPLGHDGGATPGHDGGTGASGTAAHIEIYSGNGQMAMSGWPAGDQLKVRVTDASGAPVAGVVVTWTLTLGGMGISGDGFPTGTSGSTPTDANGIARAGLRGEFLSTMESSVPSAVRASCSAGSVDFHAITTYFPLSTPGMPATYITTPDSRDFGAQTHGTVLTAGVVSQVTFQFGGSMGHGAPGIGMRFLPPDGAPPDAVPVVSCANATEGLGAGGTVFTDDTGFARCDLRVPSAPGDYAVGMRVGGAIDFTPFFLHVI